MAPARAVEPPLPLWEAGVFGGTAVTPAYPGASERSTRSLALPYLIYRGKVLRADRSGVGARLLDTDRLDFDIGFALSLPARSSDVPARRGMPDLGTLVEFGPRLKIKLAEPTQRSRLGLELPLRAVIEARGGLRRQGATFEPRFVYALQGEQQAWHVDASAGAVLGNTAINDYFYGVSPAFATGQRPAYAAKSGLMLTRLGLGGSYRLHPDWRAFAFVRYDTYTGAANRASPLLRQNNGTSAGIGLMWTWQRSSSLARGAED
ncbi:MipA/OmpV family protein [Janthinobacterium violaceinigrum]|uniref:MipA/OmpV family protein n=2 Tax=Janthinobacterium violaceinigrum TaxID=2654252 RepID=A0A6I1HZ41_9BURK|nr:MipA/OmpV family protein [Janthinobacterium violaceinigrum]